MDTSSAAKAIYSWHPLSELTACLHLVQKYLESHDRSLRASSGRNGQPSSLSLKRKRKSHEERSRDCRLGVDSPRLSSVDGQSASSNSPEPWSTVISNDTKQPNVYSGVLERREGRIVAKKVSMLFRSRSRRHC